MKTVNNLFEQIVTKENIMLAINNAAKGKRRKANVRYALRHQEEIAERLRKKLLDGTWRPCEYHRVKIINDGIKMKKRGIVCPTFVNEQVVHHAILQIVKPILMRRFYRYSCASIPTRGVEYALKYVRKNIKKDYRGTKYYAVLDIRKFFDSIKPSKVFHQLRRIIRDKRTLLLFAGILRANKVIIGEEQNVGMKCIKRGTPIGFYTSPWLANTLLTPLDNLIKETTKYYVRYNDDMLLMSGNKRKLKETIEMVREYLAGIGLELKNEPQIHKLNDVPIHFIGMKVYREKIILASKVFLRARRTAAKIRKKGFITIYDARKIISYSGRFKHFNTRLAYRKYIEGNVKRKKCRKIISKKG